MRKRTIPGFPLYVPILVSTVLGLSLLYSKDDHNMQIAEWIAIGVALIGVVGTLIGAFMQLKRDGKTIDKIAEHTSHSSYIEENTKECKKELIEQVRPCLDKIVSRNEDIQFVAEELRYQKRIKDSFSGGVADRDVVLQNIQSLYEHNAILNEALKSERQKNAILSIENQKLKQQLKKYDQHRDIAHELR